MIYLDGIYKEYERGRSMADCVREVCSLYTVNQWEKEKQKNISYDMQLGGEQDKNISNTFTI